MPTGSTGGESKYQPEDVDRTRDWIATRGRQVAAELLGSSESMGVGYSQGVVAPPGLGRLSGPWDVTVVGSIRRPLIQGTTEEWLAARPNVREAAARGDSFLERGTADGCDIVVHVMWGGAPRLIEVWHWLAIKRGTSGRVWFEAVWRPGYPKSKFSYQGIEELPRAKRAKLLDEFMAFQEVPPKGGRHRRPNDVKAEQLAQIREAIDGAFAESLGSGAVNWAVAIAGRLGVGESTVHDHLKEHDTSLTAQVEEGRLRWLRKRRRAA